MTVHGVWALQGQGFLYLSRPALRPTQPPIWVSFSVGVKWLGYGIDHSLFLPLRLKNGYSYKSNPPPPFMLCDRENFTFILNLSTLLLFQQLNAVIYFMFLLLYQISVKLLAFILACIWKEPGLIFSEFFWWLSLFRSNCWYGDTLKLWYQN